MCFYFFNTMIFYQTVLATNSTGFMCAWVKRVLMDVSTVVGPVQLFN